MAEEAAVKVMQPRRIPSLGEDEDYLRVVPRIHKGFKFKRMDDSAYDDMVKAAKEQVNGETGTGSFCQYLCFLKEIMSQSDLHDNKTTDVLYLLLVTSLVVSR